MAQQLFPTDRIGRSLWIGLWAVGLGACGAESLGGRTPAPSPVNPSAPAVVAPAPAPIVRSGGIARWDEGLPLGNGVLGVLVWGEGSTLCLSLDRGDLWDLRPAGPVGSADWTYATMRRLAAAGDHGKHVQLFDVPYDTIAHPTKLPGGRVELELAGGFEIKGFSLALDEGLVTVELERPLKGQAKATRQLRVRVHADQPLVRIEGFGELGSARVLRPGGFDRLGYAPEQRAEGGDAQAGFTGFSQTTADGGQALVAAWGRALPPGPGQPVRASLCAALLGGGAEEPLLEQARKLASDGLDGYGQSQAWPSARSKFAPPDRPWVELPDAGLQAQYDLSAYLYRAAASAGTPPMPLQGLWTADEGGLPPWKGDYHNDLNTQMTYQPYLAGNLWAEGQPWMDFNWELLPRYRRFAREFYGLSEAAAAIPGVMALNGDPLGGWGQYSLSPTNGAWIAWQVAEHWRYTRDQRFLKERAAPFCFAIGAGLAELLEPVEGLEGVLRLPLSSSPEIHDNSFAAWLAPDSNYDQALLLALFEANLELAQALGDESEAARWSGLLERLEPLDRDPETGALTFARGEPYRESHRHFSHAMSIHPLGLISIDGGAGERRLVEATLDAIDAHGTQAWVGYSFAWAAALNARGGRPERALRYLEDYLCFVGPNGFHLNGEQCDRGLSGFRYRPFTLEGNFMAMDAIHQMLLQERGGRLILFPAVSERWPDVDFSHLASPGDFLVSAERRGGRTVRVEIEAPKGGLLWLEDPFARTSESAALWSAGPTARQGSRLGFQLARGQTLLGRPSGDR